MALRMHAQQEGGHELTLLAPHVTEKAARLGEHRVYTFLVHVKAGKRDVIKAMKAIYNVIPATVRMVRTRGKSRVVRGRVGHRAATKKAYVTLSEGTTIDLS